MQSVFSSNTFSFIQYRNIFGYFTLNKSDAMFPIQDFISYKLTSCAISTITWFSCIFSSPSVLQTPNSSILVLLTFKDDLVQSNYIFSFFISSVTFFLKNCSRLPSTKNTIQCIHHQRIIQISQLQIFWIFHLNRL